METAPDPRLIPAFPSAAAQSHARAFAGTTIALHGLALVVFSGRMWSRSYPVLRMCMDDYICIIAFILVVTSSTFLLMTVPYTFGHDPNAFFLSDAQTSFKYAAIAQPLWAWSMATIKISFALMLLRIEQARRWRQFLWAMIVVQILLGIYNTLTIFLQCVPFYKAWDLVGAVPGTCWSRRAQSVSTIGVSTINILTDFIFALLPISFLRKIQRPVRERVVIGILMGLGVFAGVASIIKITAAAQFGATNDPVSESVKLGLWSVIEELVGLIVICVPCLRSPFQHALHAFGGITTRLRHYGQSRGYGRTYDGKEEGKEGDSRSRSQSRLTDIGYKLEDVRPEVNIQRPGEIWCTKEVMVDHDRLSRMPSPDWPNRGPDAVWVDHDFSLRDVEMGKAL
ncbi:hypothetical protein CC86DRAFT_423622 [Ophiobolus disseminans]|uniref:Rhodopsin domain-containing protein n=1 Tax=Ophiobolus disseminans TaxID=1469910 RepID=A0A6A6ZMY5_9PLEO|nr:hypothetical protein CC86DRAFT_423622 [Ophiobolus disseminans]